MCGAGGCGEGRVTARREQRMTSTQSQAEAQSTFAAPPSLGPIDSVAFKLIVKPLLFLLLLLLLPLLLLSPPQGRHPQEGPVRLPAGVVDAPVQARAVPGHQFCRGGRRGQLGRIAALHTSLAPLPHLLLPPGLCIPPSLPSLPTDPSSPSPLSPSFASFRSIGTPRECCPRSSPS